MLPDNEIKHKVEVTIRAMEIDDLSAVYHLGQKLFTSDEFPILYRTWDPYEVTDYFTTESEYCLVAETEDKKIVGFVLANMVEKEGTAWKKYGYLTWIGVDADYQRTNLGQRLYNKIEDTFQKEGARMVMADTDADNLGALAFLNAMGFSARAQHVWLAKTLQKPRKKKKELE
ncbi:MAG: GNAT family N-acetyltransferase [Dehalococcoidales bacterium]